MSSSLKDRIRSKDDKRSELVPVTVWEESVLVKSLTTEERIAWEVSCTKRKGSKTKTDPYKLKFQLLVATCYDPATDTKLFTDEDFAWVMQKSTNPIDELFSVACKLCGITKEDEDDVLGKDE